MRKDKLDPILQDMTRAAELVELWALKRRDRAEHSGDCGSINVAVVESDLELADRLTDAVGELERIMGECAVQVQVHQEMATTSRMNVLTLEARMARQVEGMVRLTDKLAHAKARWNYWKMKCCDRGIPGTDRV